MPYHSKGRKMSGSRRKKKDEDKKKKSSRSRTGMRRRSY